MGTSSGNGGYTATGMVPNERIGLVSVVKLMRDEKRLTRKAFYMTLSASGTLSIIMKRSCAQILASPILIVVHGC